MMWPFNSPAFIGGMKQSNKLWGRRRRARCRALAVELMESRVTLSASALLLTADTAEPLEDSGSYAADEAMIAPDSGDEVTLGTLDAEPEMFCQPVTSAPGEGEEASLDEQQSNTEAIEAVMLMGPLAWQPLDSTADDSGEMLDATLLDDPALSGSDDPSTIDLITLDPITSDTPEIVEFFASTTYYSIWKFDGAVVYENPQTLTIVFGGLLEGETAHVRDDGTFYFTREFPSGTSGLVTVTAVTPEGIESNMMSWLIF